MSEPIVLLGSGIDALVCSALLVRRGVEHRLLVETDRLGGHFAGWSPECGARVDLGMVALEEDLRGTLQLPLFDYGGESGIALRPFLGAVFTKLRELGWEFREVQMRVHTDGTVVPDYFIHDDLAYLVQLEDQMNLSRIKDKLADGLRVEPILRNKHTESTHLIGVPLSSMLKRSIGQELATHLFGGVMQQLDPDGTVEALDHRLIWIPLYWPSTLLQVLDGGEGLPPNTFLTTSTGSVATSVAGLARSLWDAGVVDFLGDHHRMNGGPRSRPGGDRLSAPSLIDFRQQSRQGPSTALRVVHFCVSTSRSETIFLRTPIDGAFRINFRAGDPTGSVSIEFGSGASGLSNGEILSSALVVMQRFDAAPICSGATMTGRVGLSGMGTPGSRMDYEPLSSRFGRNRAANFNEAVARGIAVAELLYERMS